jgi:hypothetical protein
MLVVVMVALVASTAHTRRATSLELQSVVFSRARGAAPPGSERVLVAGDSLASTFVSPTLPDFTGGGIKGVVEWASNCDVIGGVVAVAPDSITRRPPTCNFEDSYRGAVRSFDPDVSVLVLGPSTVFDRAVDGRRLTVGTPAFDDYLFGRLDGIRALLDADGARLMVTTVPCMTPPTNGPYPGLSMLQRDKTRVAAINDALRSYADQRQVAVADLGQLLCRHPEYLDVHGTGLNAKGQLAAWNLLADEVEKART